MGKTQTLTELVCPSGTGAKVTGDTGIGTEKESLERKPMKKKINFRQN